METERLISLVGKNPARETVPRPLLRLVINVDNISGASNTSKFIFFYQSRANLNVKDNFILNFCLNH